MEQEIQQRRLEGLRDRLASAEVNVRQEVRDPPIEHEKFLSHGDRCTCDKCR